jgi:hypothetical protein
MVALSIMSVRFRLRARVAVPQLHAALLDKPQTS